jgi:methyl-accepting chemotaxis protein
MALFYFILKIGREYFPDPEGEEFKDLEDAKKHAQAVAGDLMRNREFKTAHWRIQVCDDYLQPAYECLFAEINPKLLVYEDRLRDSVVRAARTSGAISDAMQQIGHTMSDLRQTMRLMDAAIAQSSKSVF